jgi:hypothetical protein
LTNREATLPATGPPIPLRQKRIVHTALPKRRRTFRGARLSKKPKSQIPKQRVFETYELTEHILSFLPPRDIFVCQRISKAFKDVIDDSHKLQELMFLRLTRTPRQTWQLESLDSQINGHGEGITSVDPAAGAVLLKLPRGHVSQVQRFVKPHLTLTPAIMNPMLLRSLVFNDRERNPDTWSPNECGYIMLMPGKYILCGSLKIKNILRDFKQHWSLLDTYLTDPPCRQAWIEYRALRVPSRISRIEFSGLLEVKTGITMGHVLNAPYTVRGAAQFTRLVLTEWQPWTSQCIHSVNGRELTMEFHSNVILNEVLESLHGEDGEPVDLCGHLRCRFLDTIIPTDRMRAGVVPYAEDVVVSDEEAGGQWLSSGDEGWASNSDEDMENW